MLGRDLTAHLAARHQLIPITRGDADIIDPRPIARLVTERQPEVVVHTAAFTAVDECERQPDLAFQVNAGGTRNVALACRQASVPMLYISTDYVFDGRKPTPYVETDTPNPVNVYGKSKLEGEKQVSGLAHRFWIVRTSWLFGPFGKNFVRAILDRARRGESLHVVEDQLGAPSYTMDLSEKLGEIIEKGSPGIYHVTNQGYCSWFEFAQEILRQAGMGHVSISPIPTSASNRPALGPRNSRLAYLRLESLGLDLLPSWRDALCRYLAREAQAKA